MNRDRTAAEARDAEDIRATLEGDLQAFGRIVERHQDVAVRVAWLVVRDQALAEDVCQDAFLRAHRGLRTFRRDAAFRPWFLQIVRNLARNAVRSRGRRDGLLDRLRHGRLGVASSPASIVEGAQTREAVLDAIARLPDAEMEVIQLRYFVDLSEAEMAATLGIPPGTVKSRLTRARSHLRNVIETHYPELSAASAFAEEPAPAPGVGADND